MNKIYAVTLVDEAASVNLYNDIKMIAYLTYNKLNEVLDLDSIKNEDLFFNSEIVRYNELNQELVITKNGQAFYKYVLLSDMDSKNEILYDPFIINSNSFGITIDKRIDNVDIKSVLDEILVEGYQEGLITKQYSYQINKIEYKSERDRVYAIKKIKKELKVDKESKIKKLIRKIWN